MPSLMLRVADDFLSSGFLDSEDVAKSAKAKLVQILDQPDLDPLYVLPLPRESKHVSIWISAIQEKRLLALGSAQNLSFGVAASEILLREFERAQAAALAAKAEPPREIAKSLGVLEAALQSKGWAIRSEQQSIQRELVRLMDADGLPAANAPRVLFCEAGTGTGKTLAYLGSALDHLQSNPTHRVYVAAPSFALLSQVRKELEFLLTAATSKISYAFLAGQSEFVSEQALQAMIDDEEDKRLTDQEKQTLLNLLVSWRRTGICSSDVAPKDRPWAMPALIHAMPDFQWTSDISLADRFDDDDSGWRSYEQQFKNAHDARLVVMTHAMLANLVKRRMAAQSRATNGDESIGVIIEEWKNLPLTQREERLHVLLNRAVADLGSDAGCDRLPNADLLIVDEAHTIEDTFANAFGSYLSLWSLEKDIRKLAKTYPDVFSQNAHQPLHDLIQALKQENGAEIIDLNSGEHNKKILNAFWYTLASAINPTKEASKSKTNAALKSKEARAIQSAIRTTDVVLAAMDKSNAVGAFLHWSPHKEYPRFSMGKLYLDRELDYVWSQVTQRTALVSGTLYEEFPKPSCESLRRALAVPYKSVMTMTPIHSAWQFTPVTLLVVPHIKSIEGGARFIRPSSKTDKQTRVQLWRSWMNDVADYSVRAVQSAKGGTMILGTAFDDIKELSQRLRVSAGVGENPAFVVLEQRKGVTLQGLREEFLQESRKGPTVLCAVGAAWTGFDLHDPLNADALTDLVILNAPFGVSNTTISRIRRQMLKNGHFEVAARALVLVRQACGRLVRSPDTPANRRVHWLDARIHEPSMAGMMLPIKRFLAKYKQIQVA